MTGKTTVKSGGHAYSGAYHGIKSGVDYRRTVGSFGHRAVMSPAGLPMPVDKDAPLFAALDVGTNSCRMLIARPNVSGFDVLDAFSKIIYLGSGLEKTGVLSEKAIVRAVEALQVCATKLSYHKVQHTRMITTAPARMAKNGQEFVAQIDAQTGLKLEIVSPEQEARLAAIGCAAHLKVTTEQALIGGYRRWVNRIDLDRLLCRSPRKPPSSVNAVGCGFGRWSRCDFPRWDSRG